VGKAVWQDCKGAMVLAGAYDEAVKMMGDIQFLTALQNFPKEGITDETVELLKPYFSAPDFNYDSAKKARRAPRARRPRVVTPCLHVPARPCGVGWTGPPALSHAVQVTAGAVRRGMRASRGRVRRRRSGRAGRAQASGNVAGLCNWAAAMCTYHDVAKVVEPKTVALRGAEAKLKVAMREKGAALDELAVVQGRLDEMQERWPPSCGRARS